MNLEILAPAGNADCANAAIHNGANAIYLGFSSFSARRGAENFDEEGLRKIVQRAHVCGVKVYVAMNTLVKDEELEVFFKTLVYVWNVGADAIILQDIFLGKLVKERYPEIELHASTQAGVCDVNGARLAKAYGFSRVILARETPLAAIAEIAKIIETEAFVQGALCTCYSGQCYFSSFAGGNSGNRGGCKQPCRKPYAYDRNGNVEKNYALSLSDLSVGEQIQKYIDAGVTSFKIEGRMRRAEYVAAAVRYYRGILDGATNLQTQAALSDLKRTYNRGNYTGGLAFGQDKRFLSTAIQGHVGEKVGTVKVLNGKYFVESTFKPRTGDAFKILREGKEIGGGVFEKLAGRGFTVAAKQRLKNGDGVFVTTDTSVNERVLSAEKRGEISLYLRFVEGELASFSGGGVQVIGDEPLETAATRPLTVDELKNCFSKTDGAPVTVRFENIELKGDIFIPKSKLNALRRTFFERFLATVANNGRGAVEYRSVDIPTLTGRNAKTAVITSDLNGVTADIVVYKPDDYSKPINEAFINGTFEKYIYYPAFATKEDTEAIERLAAFADGVYGENYGAITFAKERGFKLFAGTGFNLFNRLSVAELLKEPCVRYYAISKETTAREAELLTSDRAFVLSAGDIKLMDLCYCPFGKTCKVCDKKDVYELTDENARAFPVRRYRSADGSCRFEVYNCAKLIGKGIDGAGQLLDLSTIENKSELLKNRTDEDGQKRLFDHYTSGHFRRGVL